MRRNSQIASVFHKPKGYPGFLFPSLVILLLSTISLSACSPEPASPAISQLSGSITEAGSTTVQPLAEKLAGDFMAANPMATITIQGGGTDVGIKSASDGTVNIGAASRDLSPDDPRLVKFIIARDGIAIVVNPQNPVNGLTKDQVRDIFAGNTTDWSQLGGRPGPIDVASREEGSGTRASFEEFVMGGNLITSRAILQSSNGALTQVVRGDTRAISFVSFGAVDGGIKALAINGVAATEASAANGTYPFVRPLYFLTDTEPAGLVKAFIDYCLGPEGQKIASSEGFIPVGR